MEKTVLITGASRWIGSSTAEVFASHGFHIILNYVQNEKKAMKLAKELEEYKDEKIKKIGVLLEKSLREEIYRRQREEEKEQERYNTFE